MDELSPLFHDIEFNERFRGYDVEEVDAYVDRVAKAAALVQGRIAELQNRVSAAEARPASASAAAPELEGVDEASMTRMLVLAQRTADAAIDEANEEAVEIRKRAEDHASLVLAEAETDRRQILADAETAAAAAASDERDRLAAEVAELERHRAFLRDDIEILDQHLVDSRAALAASVASLTQLIEEPGSFRAPAMPATSGFELPETAVDADAAEHTEASDDRASEESDLDVDPFDDVEFVEVSTTVEPETPSAVDTAPVMEAAPEMAIDSPAEVAVEAEPEPIDSFVGEPTAMMDAVVTDEPAADPALTFDPAPLPETPERVDEEWAAEAPSTVVESTDDTADAVADVEAMPAAEVIDMTGPITAETPAIVDLTEPESHEPLHVDEPISGMVPPVNEFDTGTHTAVAPPLLVTAADLEDTPSDDDWIDDLRQEAGTATDPAPVADDGLLFADAEPAAAGDAFLDQLRDAVNGPDSEEFGEDALAAFFDGDDDQGDRNWFNRRR